jgi:hypothetical protein
MKARLAGLPVLAFVLVSCGGNKPVEINPQAESVGVRWNGTLSTPPELAGVEDMRGAGWLGGDPKNPNQSLAHIDVSNAVPGGLHPWHVHKGQCGSDQGILGPPDAYKPLKIEGDGKASATAELSSVPLPRSGSYFINVHASAKNLKTIVACGNLAPPAR